MTTMYTISLKTGICCAMRVKIAGPATWPRSHFGLKVFHTTDFDVLQHVNIVLADLRKYIVENYEHEDYEKKE